ncbi:hypothetical protein VPH35_066761 [Triticum aestivum]
MGNCQLKDLNLFGRHQLAVRGRRGMLTPCSMLLQTWSPGAHGSVAPRAPLEEPPPCTWPPWSWSASCPTPLVCSGGGFLLAAMMPEAGRYTCKKDDGICNSKCCCKDISVVVIVCMQLTRTTSAATSPTRARWQRRPMSSPLLMARACATWMVAAKANAGEDVVPEFIGGLIPFDKARATTSGGWLCEGCGGGRRRTLKERGE